MAKLKSLPELSIIDGMKGTIDFYVHDGVACARMWPRSPGHLRAPAVMAGWTTFTEAVHLWNELSVEVKQAYYQMAHSTKLTGRDVFIKSYISGIKTWSLG